MNVVFVVFNYNYIIIRRCPMKYTKNRLNFVILVALLVSLVLSVPLQAGYSEKGKCQDALLRCMVSAGLSMFGNPGLAAAMAGWCISGYVWCLQFYEE
jgi:hypothetical protein